MDYIKIESSNLDSIAYDPELCALFVRFKNGGEYCYEGFPPGAFELFMASESKGKHLQTQIKGKYPSRKVELIEEEDEDDDRTAYGPGKAFA